MRFRLLMVLVLLSLSTAIAQKSDPVIKGAPDESGILVIQPELSDIEFAKNNGFEVVKILSRGTLADDDNEYGLRGGGAVYSFLRKSHSYNRSPQLGLEKGYLQSGFYGANLGFIKDIGGVALSSVDEKNADVAFMLSYVPPKYEPDAREEWKKLSALDSSLSGFKTRAPAVAGNTYILRGILYNDGDSLTAFNIHRINQDGSMVIFWKPIKEFTKTTLLRFKDSDIKAKVDEVLTDSKFASVSAEVKDNRILLQGSVADSEYANLIRLVMQIPSLGLINQVAKARNN